MSFNLTFLVFVFDSLFCFVYLHIVFFVSLLLNLLVVLFASLFLNLSVSICY